MSSKRFGHLWGIATRVEDVSPKELKERMKKVMQAAWFR
jgi:PhnB protein